MAANPCPASGRLCPNVRRVWTALLGAERTLLVPVRQALREAGIPGVEAAEALLALEAAPEHRLRPFELERALRRPQYATSRLVDRLEQEGFVERESCPTDGRGHHVALTVDGKAAARRVEGVYARVLMQAIGGRVGVEAVPGMADMLERIAPAEG
jgi:DNA-binding MarR family transcriptional regulator